MEVFVIVTCQVFWHANQHIKPNDEILRISEIEAENNIQNDERKKTQCRNDEKKKTM